VAIKIVDKSSISDVNDVERVCRETFILTSLKHENIIRLYDVGALARAASPCEMPCR
jgi:serine/threonine protein kinase